jgi:hypothetical protein
MSDLFVAESIVVVHALFVAFVVVGQLAIVVGALLRFGWARNFWFRLAHLSCIAIVALEDTVGWECPLTRWDREIRIAAGIHLNEHGTFMAQIAEKTIYHNADDISEETLQKLNIGFAVLVFLTFVIAPPRWPWKKGQSVFHGVLFALVVGLTYVLFGPLIALAVAATGAALLGGYLLWARCQPAEAPPSPPQPPPSGAGLGEQLNGLSALPPPPIYADGGKDSPGTVKTHEANGS